MNWLDVILIIVNILLIVGVVTLSVLGGFEGFFYGLMVAGFAMSFTAIPFIILDRGSGSTIGEITSVDKNFFGTTALYVKTSETTQEKYCIEDKDIASIAGGLIGKKVKISYGERVGLYSTGRCSSAPIEKIEELNND